MFSMGVGGAPILKDTELNFQLLERQKNWRPKIRGLFPPPPPPILCHCMFIVHFSHTQCDLFQDYEQISMSNYRASCVRTFRVACTGNLCFVKMWCFTLHSMGRINHKFPVYATRNVQTQLYDLFYFELL